VTVLFLLIMGISPAAICGNTFLMLLIFRRLSGRSIYEPDQR